MKKLIAATLLLMVFAGPAVAAAKQHRQHFNKHINKHFKHELKHHHVKHHSSHYKKTHI